MRGVDLNRYAFDFDLTFGALLMHADGHVYHRYGGRDHRSASRWLSASSFESLLEHTLGDHAEYQVPSVLAQRLPLRIETLPSFKKRDKGACIHCHSVYPAFYEEQLAAGSWQRRDVWKHPSPLRIGLDLDRDDQRRIVQLRPGSQVAEAGLRVGDRLLAMNGTEVMTASDVMFELEQLPWKGGPLAFSWERAGEQHQKAIPLAPGWKRGSPLEFSWRPSKWGLHPAPGFGGQQLSPEERLAADIPESADGDFALRVTYMVTWGENKRFGEAAGKAGLREGDVLYQVAGRRDFATPDHLHAWWRLTRKVGDEVELRLMRKGSGHLLLLKVIE